MGHLANNLEVPHLGSVQEEECIALGISCYLSGNYSEAATQFEKATKLDPRNYKAFDYLAAAQDCLGSSELAKDTLRASLDLRDAASALNSMGAILVSQRNDLNAIPFFECALALKPDHYTYALNLGDSRRRLGQPGEAKEAYLKGLFAVRLRLAANPGDHHLHAFVAYFSVRLGDAGTAESEIARALSLLPNDSRVVRRAVLTYAALNQDDRTAEVLENAAAELVEDLKRHPDLDYCSKKQVA